MNTDNSQCDDITHINGALVEDNADVAKAVVHMTCGTCSTAHDVAIGSLPWMHCGTLHSL